MRKTSYKSRIFFITLVGILFLTGCSSMNRWSALTPEAISGDEPDAVQVQPPMYAEPEMSAADEFEMALVLYEEALDSAAAGNNLTAQNLFENAIIKLAELDSESVDVDAQDLASLRRELASDYAAFLAGLDELPEESSPSAVYIGLSEFLGDSIGSTEDLLGLMIPAPPEVEFADPVGRRQLYPDIPIIVNSYVQRAIQYYSTKGRKVFSKWLKRAEEAIPYYSAILKQEGMPEELVYLAMVESGFSSTAYSRAHASGPWQFISSTARLFGLKVNYWYDERRDKEKSTRAACDYLKKLYDEFGDWYLAFAAYNCGERRVQRAIRRSGKRDYWSLRRYLPRQTREYVPSILAAAIIAGDPEKYGFEPLRLRPPPETRTVEVKGCVSLKEVAKAADVDLQTVRALNPALKRDCTPPEVDTFRVIIPADAGKDFDRKIAEAPRLERSNWVRHRIRRGETLSTIAAKYGVSMRAIMSIPSNNLRNPHKIRAGRYLMIPVGEGRGDVVVEPRIGDPQPLQIASGDGRVRSIYRVRKGDSLSKIARRYGVSVSSLKSWNNLWGKKYIYPGQNLIVWTKAAASEGKESQWASVGPPKPGSASKAGVEVHVVQPGDTLWDISRLYGVSVRDLMNWNGIRSARRLKPGMALKLQP